MKKWLFGSGIMMLGMALVFAACSKKSGDDDKDPAKDNFDRKAMLVNYADNYIIPAYAEMYIRLEHLQAKISQFTSAPSANSLIDARTAFNQAYVAWQRTDMLEFGPAEGISLRMYINTYPVTTSKLNANIASGNYNLEEFGNKDAQGFPAVDYLLNGLGTDAEILAFYTTDAQATARKKYLGDVAAKMLDKLETVNTGWATYKSEFTNSTGTDAGSSISKMVNAFVLYYERYLRSGKIGLPAGAMTGTAKPELSEAFYSPGLQDDLAVVALTSVKDFYEGKYYIDNAQEGKGMKSYLAAIGTKDDNGKLMADLISEEMGQALAKMQTINGSIAANVQTNRPEVLKLYDELQQVVPLLKVDMVSAFGISITYVDNDGD